MDFPDDSWLREGRLWVVHFQDCRSLAKYRRKESNQSFSQNCLFFDMVFTKSNVIGGVCHRDVTWGGALGGRYASATLIESIDARIN